MGWREIMVLKMKYTAVLFVVMVTMAASQSVDNQQLECDMKKLAVQYAEDLLPNHEGVSKLVQDALQIQNVCGDGDTLDHVERERPASAHKHDHCTVFDVRGRLRPRHSRRAVASAIKAGRGQHLDMLFGQFVDEAGRKL